MNYDKYQGKKEVFIEDMRKVSLNMKEQKKYKVFMENIEKTEESKQENFIAVSTAIGSVLGLLTGLLTENIGIGYLSA